MSPGFLKLLAAFMFKASVKIKPSNPNSFFNKSLTTFLESEVGTFASGSKLGTLKCATITETIPSSNIRL